MFINYSMLLAILPQILLVILGGIVLILELVLSKDQYRNIGWVTAIGMAFILLLSIPTIPKESGKLTWGGMIKHDWIGYIFTVMVVFGAGISALFAMDFKSLGKQGGFFVLIISATLGMSFMASAADLVLLFVAIETSSLSLYILASLFTNEDESAEAGFKYFLFGALTSTIITIVLFAVSSPLTIYHPGHP